MRLIGPASIKRRLAREDGFTMLFALLALMVGTLLVAAAFTSANGDIKLTQRSTVEAKAYYAAVAGVDRYQYQLTSSPEYWTKCPTITNSEGGPVTVPGTTDESYTVKTLASSTSKKTACESGKQATILETKAPANGTFRILSTGTAKEGGNTVTRQIVATFSHPGFTKYVYESNFEVEDPVNFNREAKTCEYYYKERVEKKLTSLCPVIQFAPTDEVNGPMHTNDAAATCTSGGNSPKFGREGYNDEIAMLGGHYAPSGCTNSPNIVGEYTESAASILPPPTDQEILEAAEMKFDGRTEIELKTGSPNTMLVKNKGTENTYNFPSNGVLYVENSKSETCAITNYSPFNADTENDSGCGNVYVHGEYTESLTIASADDVIINGNLVTSHESNGEPTGGATLGLIAENFVRLYHPVKKGYEPKNSKPPTEAARNGRCVTIREAEGKVVRSTEVTGITTSGLETGAEVEGAGIEAGTTVSELKSFEKKLKLSKAAKPGVAAEITTKLASSSEITNINTTGLEVGQEVEGAGIESGTKITEVKASEKKIKLSKAAKSTTTEQTGVKITRSTEVLLASTAGLEVGEEVEGTGIEAGTTISEIKAAEKKIKLSKAPKLTATSAAGKTLRTEVTGITTTGLEPGQEVEGTNIEAGTTITEVKATEKKIKLSTTTKVSAVSLTGKLTNGSTEVTSLSTTTGLEVGEEVEGSGIVAGTTITELKSSEKKLKLSKAATATGSLVPLKFFGENATLKYYGASVTLKFSSPSTLKFYGENTTLKFWVTSSTYEYNSALNLCHKIESGWGEYRESENVYIESCKEGSYKGNLFCEYENTSSNCASKAENMTAAEDPNHWGSQENPVIDAAILSTNHSWIVDNYKCGKALGKLTVWGSIAQFWRGPVGQAGGSGYIKNYNYDNRLANQQPPSFLSPTNASSWKISRETAPPAGFTG